MQHRFNGGAYEQRISRVARERQERVTDREGQGEAICDRMMRRENESSSMGVVHQHRAHERRKFWIKWCGYLPLQFGQPVCLGCAYPHNSKRNRVIRHLTELRIGIPVSLNAHREKGVASLYVVRGYPPIADSRRPFDLGC